MIFSVFLKLLGEMSYYAAFAAFFGSLFGPEASSSLPALLGPLAFLALLGAASFSLSEKYRKKLPSLLPFLLMPLTLFLLPRLAEGLLLLPPAAYTVYLAAAGLYRPDHGSSADSFRRLSLILPVPLAFALIAGQSERLNVYSMPYLLVFFLAEVALLRMLRHSEEVLASPRFQLLNASLLLLLTGFIAFLSGTACREAAKKAFSFLYRFTVEPLLKLIMLVFFGLAWLLMQLFSFVIHPVEGEKLREELNTEFSFTELFGDTEGPVRLPWLLLILRILGALLLAFLLWLALSRLFRILKERGRPDHSSAASYSARSRISGSFPRPLRRLRASSPQDKVRYYYQEFLYFMIRNGFSYAAGMTSSDIEEGAVRMLPAAAEGIRKLHALYRPARYGGEVPADAPEQARYLYKEIRQIAKNR